MFPPESALVGVMVRKLVPQPVILELLKTSKLSTSVLVVTLCRVMVAPETPADVAPFNTASVKVILSVAVVATPVAPLPEPICPLTPVALTVGAVRSMTTAWAAPTAPTTLPITERS